MKALVATASLELGIDIGTVDLVCQLESPRSITTFLQRVGRSGHALGLTPKGRPLPDDPRRAGRVRRPRPRRAPRPPRPRRARRWRRSTSSPSRSSPSAPARPGARTTCSRSSAAPGPTATSSREDFDEVVEMLSEGIAVGSGRAAALPAPRPHQRRAPRPPRRAHDGDPVRRRHPGDRRLPRHRRARRHVRRHAGRGLRDREHGRRHLPARHHLLAHPAHRVAPASCASRTPTARRRRSRSGSAKRPAARSSSREEVSELRRRHRASGSKRGERRRSPGSRRECALPPRGRGADRALRAARSSESLGRRAVADRTSSSSASSTRAAACSSSSTRRSAARINRAWGSPCASASASRFDFELQAAASDDAMLLSIGPQHSFPLEDMFALVRSPTLEETRRAGAARAVADVRRPLALERHARARHPAPAQRQARAAAAPAHAGRTTCWPRCSRALVAARRTSPAPSSCRTTRSCARRCTTACTRRWTSTGCATCWTASSAARSASTPATRRSRRRSRTRCSTRSRTRTWTTRRWRSAAPAP